MPLHLNAVAPGEEVFVLSVRGDKPLAVRLLDMGFTPGTRLKVSLCSPSGDPMVVQLRGYTLSLRREEAACIFVSREAQP